MTGNGRYRLRRPEVTLESFEGESIVIDFASGCYYSLSASASEMLALLASGAAHAEIAARLTVRHPGVSARLGADLEQLLQRLLTEKILVAEDGSSPADEVALPERVPAYLPPALERFEDMREMLLLDPIHEIEQATWGTAPTNGAQDGPA